MLGNRKMGCVRVNLSRQPFFGMSHGVHCGASRNPVRRHQGVEGFPRRRPARPDQRSELRSAAALLQSPSRKEGLSTETHPLLWRYFFKGEALVLDEAGNHQAALDVMRDDDSTNATSGEWNANLWKPAAEYPEIFLQA